MSKAIEGDSHFENLTDTIVQFTESSSDGAIQESCQRHQINYSEPIVLQGDEHKLKLVFGLEQPGSDQPDKKRSATVNPAMLMIASD